MYNYFFISNFHRQTDLSVTFQCQLFIKSEIFLSAPQNRLFESFPNHPYLSIWGSETLGRIIDFSLNL